MLQINHLTVTHRKDSRVLLNDFSFALNPEDRAVLIGEEGDGKSTLLKLIYDETLVEGYADYTGKILRDGLRLGYLGQELPERECGRSIEDFCLGSPAGSLPGPAELSDAALALGLDPSLLRSPRKMGTLSGGEKVRVQLARLLLERPDVLLLDEPSNDLDLTALGWLESFLTTCGLPALFVSHDETLIERTANVVIHLEQLRRKTLPRWTVARMPYRRYAEDRLARFSRQEQAARREEAEYRRQQKKFQQIQSKVEYRQATVSRQDPHSGQLLKKKMKAVKSMGRRLEREHADSTQMPDFEDSILIRFPEDVSIPNGKTVLDFQLDELAAQGRVLAKNILLRVTGPEKICIIGPNGMGKTTLLRSIAQAMRERRDVRAGYMPQNYAELLGGGVTPVEFLAETGSREEISSIRTFLGSMKYTADEMTHPAGELSGGQKAKLLFLRMILQRCDVLLLDEPTRNFSPLSGPVIRDALKSFGGAIISVSHDRKYIAEVCGRVYRLTADGLQTAGPAADDGTPKKGGLSE